MNIFVPLPLAEATVSNGTARWKKLGIGVILAFTLKGLVTGSLLAIMLSEFIHY